MKKIILLFILAQTLIACSEQSSEGATGEACGSGQEFFSARFVEQAELTAIAPLGTINPPHHTYPTAHMYPALRTDQMVALDSPGNAIVTSIARTRWLVSPFRQGHADYSIRLKPCNEITMTFGHVTQLNSDFARQVGEMDQCITRSTPDETVEECTVNLSILVSAGQHLGFVGQPGIASGFDWGMTDDRVNNFFVNPVRQDHLTRVVCPIDYFTADLKAELEALTGRTEGPVCGEVAYDVANTAQGIWILESQTDASYIEQYGLTLGKNHQNPLLYTFGIAQVGSDLDSSTLDFAPQSSGLIDRDFADVTADGQIYCYNEWSSRILIQLDTDGSLIFETQAGLSCSSPGYSFTSSQLRFIR